MTRNLFFNWYWIGGSSQVLDEVISLGYFLALNFFAFSKLILMEMLLSVVTTSFFFWFGFRFCWVCFVLLGYLVFCCDLPRLLAKVSNGTQTGFCHYQCLRLSVGTLTIDDWEFWAHHGLGQVSASPHPPFRSTLFTRLTVTDLQFSGPTIALLTNAITSFT